MPRERNERMAAIYARVSTEEQTRGQITSTATQVEKCREKAAELVIPVAAAESGLIVEEHHSGADLRWEGTQFMALARRAEAGEFTDLICKANKPSLSQRPKLMPLSGITPQHVCVTLTFSSAF